MGAIKNKVEELGKGIKMKEGAQQKKLAEENKYREGREWGKREPNF